MPNSKFPSSRVSSESLLASILPAPSLSPKSEASRSTVTLLLDCLAVTTIFYFNKFIILFAYVSMTLSYQTGYDKKNASEIVKNYIETLLSSPRPREKKASELESIRIFFPCSFLHRLFLMVLLKIYQESKNVTEELRSHGHDKTSSVLLYYDLTWGLCLLLLCFSSSFWA